MLYWRRFPGDYANDTRHLTFAEHGAYSLLLDYCYATEKPLPKDKQEIYRKICARTPKERAIVDRILDEFFVLRRQGYIQGRVKEEISRASSKSEVRRASGRKGGLKRQANARLLLKQNLASQTPDSRLQTSQDHSAAAVFTGNGTEAAAAFSAIGFDKPFGQPKFQQVFLEEFQKPAQWLTMKLEATIQHCQRAHIGIPPQFYDAKHDVEARENRQARSAPL